MKYTAIIFKYRDKRYETYPAQQKEWRKEFGTFTEVWQAQDGETELQTANRAIEGHIWLRGDRVEILEAIPYASYSDEDLGDITPSQRTMINRLLERAAGDFYGASKWANGEQDLGYEVKALEITHLYGGKIVQMVITTGMTNDEGTAASWICRKTRQIFIGPRGGLTAHDYSDGKSKMVTGRNAWFTSL